MAAALSSAAGAIDFRAADIPLLHGDRAVLERDVRAATLLTVDPHDDGRLLHPFLTTVAVVFAWWDQRHVFHGGTFVDARGRAWGLLGSRGSGKSSMLARLSLAGLRVLSDDLIVIRDDRVLGGPACVDLRPDAAAALLGSSEQAFPVRHGERLRLPVRPHPVEAVLHGWIFLHWGEQTSLRRLGPSEWLAAAAEHRGAQSRDTPSLLGLAGGEAWELRRPRGWGSFEPAVERLLDLVGR